VNPGHVELAISKRAIGRAQVLAGNRKGEHIEQKRRSILLAHLAQGKVAKPQHVRDAIRDAGRSVTGRALAASLGVSEQYVSKMRKAFERRA
jgi:hypothetical protein